MSARAGLTMAGLGVAIVLGSAPGAAATVSTPSRVTTAIPCPHGQPAGPHLACTGPVTHHAGGGGGTLAIGLSVIVGVGVAAGALVLVRKRIADDATRPRPAARPRRPS